MCVRVCACVCALVLKVDADLRVVKKLKLVPETGGSRMCVCSARVCMLVLICVCFVCTCVGVCVSACMYVCE
jgi:hypothetical protein